MNIAVMDIGSNSSRLDLFAVAADGSYEHLLFGRVPTGLVGHVDGDNALSDEGVRLAASSLMALQIQALKTGLVDEWHVFATASLRGRSNEREVVAALKERTGFEVDVIEGIEEAKLGYASLQRRYRPQCAVMADVGGGSTEVVVADGGEVLSVTSHPLGSRALSKRLIADVWPNEEELEAIRRAIAAELTSYAKLSLSSPPVLFGIGGTARALEAVLDADKIDLPADLHTRVEHFCPDRLDTMAAGALIFQGLWESFKPQRFVASDANPREGYLLKHVLG